MATNSCRHWAICPETGEVLGSSTVNGLKRHLARNIRWLVRNGYPAGKWCFYHGSREGLRAKFQG